ncbi:MAG: distal tail protein Dit [Desulfosporosinus sp.]
MERGFTLNGQHCSGLGVVMESKTVPIITGSNDAYLQVPGRDGSYMFPRELADGAIPIACGILTATAIELMIAKRQIAAWVYSEQKVQLIFDDEPDKYYLVKYNGAIGLDKMKTPGMGKFTLVFRCDPSAYSVNPLNREFNDPVFLAPFMAIATDPIGSMILNNSGTKEAFPVFTVTFIAVATEIKIANGSDYVRVVRTFAEGDVLVVNCGLGKITLNGLREMASLDWQNSKFFSIAPGLTTLTVLPTNASITSVQFIERWL